MSRTIPVNGVYSPRQRVLYEALLRVFKFARSLMVVGNTWETYNLEVGKKFTEELLTIGLLTAEEVEEKDQEKPSAYRKYCMHGVSHFLGLDTHDVGDRYRPFEAGMVLTCEPGIYIPDEKVGLRIENDILITAEGPVDLMEGIPLEIEEIEAAMKETPMT